MAHHGRLRTGLRRENVHFTRKVLATHSERNIVLFALFCFAFFRPSPPHQQLLLASSSSSSELFRSLVCYFHATQVPQLACVCVCVMIVCCANGDGDGCSLPGMVATVCLLGTSGRALARRFRLHESLTERSGKTPD